MHISLRAMKDLRCEKPPACSAGGFSQRTEFFLQLEFVRVVRLYLRQVYRRALKRVILKPAAAPAWFNAQSEFAGRVFIKGVTVSTVLAAWLNFVAKKFFPFFMFSFEQFQCSSHAAICL